MLSQTCGLEECESGSSGADVEVGHVKQEKETVNVSNEMRRSSQWRNVQRS